MKMNIIVAIWLQIASSASVKAQPIIGYVFDSANGEPIIGAVVRGDGKNYITDNEGKFVANVSPGDKLIVSCIGEKAKTVRAQNNMEIALGNGVFKKMKHASPETTEPVVKEVSSNAKSTSLNKAPVLTLNSPIPSSSLQDNSAPTSTLNKQQDIRRQQYARKMKDDDTKFEWIEFCDGVRKGVKNVNGKILVPCEYDDISYLNNYFIAKDSVQNTSALFDESGELLIPKEKGYVSFGSYYLKKQGYCVAYKENKAVLLNSRFQEVVPFSRGYSDFTKIYFKDYGYCVARKNKYVTLLNWHFQEEIPISRCYSDIVYYDLKDVGFCKAKKGGNMVLLNSQFQEVIPASRGYTEFDVYYLKEYGFCKAKKGDNMVLLNSQFQEVVPASRGYTEFDAYYLKDGFCKAKKGDNMALLNSQFQEVVPLSRGYTEFDVYYIKLYGFCKAKKGDNMALLNSQFQEVVPASRGYTEFDVYYFKDGFCKAKKGDSMALLNSQFQEVVPASRGYSDFNLFYSKDGFIEIIKGDYRGLCDLQGKELVTLDNHYGKINIITYKEEIELIKQDGTKKLLTYSIDGNTIKLSEKSGNRSENTYISPSSTSSYTSTSTSNSDLLYEGIYTATGKGYNYTLGQYSDSGVASLNQVAIYQNKIIVNGKTIDYWKSDGAWLWYGQNGGHPIYLYNPSTGELRMRFVFNFLGAQVTDNFWVRGNHLTANTGTNIGTGASSSTSSSSTTITTTQKKCGLCDGHGWIPTDEGVSNLGSTRQKWCEECKKWVATNHWHKSCPSCKGKGYY